ncbi:MAG TPA: NAD(P)H-dependent oxidoreductase, partial [Cyclobacteriaceae bacterium]|nr:NAD(P)H-dependent oxidoreductase [Cyclobacteriaceae bacterium]
MKKLKIMAIPGSLRANSSTHIVLHEIERLIPSDIEFEIFDGVGALPHFDGAGEIPSAVKNFLQKMGEADGILICTPEYAFGVPGSLKNALDWTVGTTDFTNKPTALITASTGGERAHESMLQTLTALSADVKDGSVLLISFIRSKIREGKIMDQGTRESILAVIHTISSQCRARTR